MTNEEWLNGLSTEDKVDIIIRGACSICVHKDECILPEHSCRDGIMKYLQQTHVKPMPKLVKGDILKLKFMYKDGTYRLEEATYLGRDIICVHYQGVASLRFYINDISEIYRLAETGKQMELIWEK